MILSYCGDKKEKKIVPKLNGPGRAGYKWYKPVWKSPQCSHTGSGQGAGILHPESGRIQTSITIAYTSLHINNVHPHLYPSVLSESSVPQGSHRESEYRRSKFYFQLLSITILHPEVGNWKRPEKTLEVTPAEKFVLLNWI